MARFLKLLLLLVLLFRPLAGQAPQSTTSARYYVTTGDQSLSGAGTQMTIQANNGKRVQFEVAVVYCSAACTITQTQNGTAATNTAATIRGIQPVSISTATAWFPSNVGAGTASSGALHLQGPATVTLDLSRIYFAAGSTGATNYTVAIGTMTGTANITIYWGEQ
jgi:hypothetical protein